MMEIVTVWDGTFQIVAAGEVIATAKTRAEAEQKKLVAEFDAGAIQFFKEKKNETPKPATT